MCSSKPAKYISLNSSAKQHWAALMYMKLRYTLFGFESSSDRLSSHIGNFDYLDNKNLFLVPLFWDAKLAVQIL